MYPNQYISKLIETAINDENMTSLFYNKLANSVSDIDDKKLLLGMSMDEEKHSKMLTQLYDTINNILPETTDAKVDLDENLICNIVNALMGEIETIEKYRVLLFAFEKPEYKNIITDIIFDEQNHSAKLNYLYSKNNN